MSTPAQKQEALFLGDIRKTYHTGTFDVPVLKGVNFEVYRGEFIGIMGSSGSGKSTLLNILGLLDQPSSGTYRLDGISVEYSNWWFNVRASNTEPLLRLNVEASDEATMIEKRDEILALFKS